MTAQERMEQSTVSRPDREAWVDYFTERFALTLVEETITSPLERGTYVLVTEPMARERGWCVDLFKQPRYSEKLSWGHYDTRTWKYVQYDPPRLIQHQKVYRGMWIVLLDVTNTQLAAHFEETSAFTDDGLWDLLGEVLRDYDTGRFSTCGTLHCPAPCSFASREITNGYGTRTTETGGRCSGTIEPPTEIGKRKWTSPISISANLPTIEGGSRFATSPTLNCGPSSRNWNRSTHES